MDTLADYGVLVFASEADESTFRERVVGHPSPATRERWAALLPRISRRRLALPTPPRPLAQIADTDTLASNWSGLADVAGVAAARASSFTLSDGELSLYVEGPAGAIEVVRHDDLDGAEIVEGLRKLSRELIPAGEERDDTWSVRFALLAQSSRHVVIVDRYAGANLVRTPARRRGERDGVGWLLQRLDQEGAVSVEVITACEVEGSDSARGPTLDQVTNALGSLRGSLTNGGVRSLQAAILRQPGAMHDRFLRFDHHAFAVSQGMKPFGFARSPEAWSCDRREVQQVRAHEGELRSRCEARALRRFW